MKKYKKIRKQLADIYCIEGMPKPDWYIKKECYIDIELIIPQFKNALIVSACKK